MKIINYKIVVGLCLASLLNACADEDNLDPNSVVSSSRKSIGNYQESKLDKYLKREFLDPYNIRVKYHLDDTETDLNYNVVPAKEEKVIQIVTLIKHLCLDVYKKHAGEDFLKKNFPKTIVLVGSKAWKGKGQAVLGTAQDGVKILLYDINSFRTRNITEIFATIFHEFSHILHQKKKFSPDYEKISGLDYAGDQFGDVWSYRNPYKAKGFVTDYSSKNKEEDFVEIISKYIVFESFFGYGDFDEYFPEEIASDDKNKEGLEKIRQKLGIVKSYLDDKWNINLDDLRKEFQERNDNIKSFDMNNID